MPSTRNRGRNCELLSAKLVEVGLLRKRDLNGISASRSSKSKLKKPSPCKKIKQEDDEDDTMISEYRAGVDQREVKGP
jgi:hypothetical protein